MIDKKLNDLVDKLNKISESEEFDIYDICQYHRPRAKPEDAAYHLCLMLEGNSGKFKLTDWERDFIFRFEKGRWGIIPHILRIWKGLEELKYYFSDVGGCDAEEYKRLLRIREA